MKQVFIKKITKFTLVFILFSMSYTKIVNANEIQQLNKFLNFNVEIGALNNVASKLGHDKLHKAIEFANQQRINPARELSPLEKAKLDTLYQIFLTEDRRLEREELKVELSEKEKKIKTNQPSQDLLLEKQQIEEKLNEVKKQKADLTKKRKEFEIVQKDLQKAEAQKNKTHPCVENVSEIIDKPQTEIATVEVEMQTNSNVVKVDLSNTTNRRASNLVHEDLKINEVQISVIENTTAIEAFNLENRLETQVVNLDTKVSQQENNINKVATQVVNLETKVSQQENNINTIATQVSTLENKLDTRITNLENKSNTQIAKPVNSLEAIDLTKADARIANLLIDASETKDTSNLAQHEEVQTNNELQTNVVAANKKTRMANFDTNQETAIVDLANSPEAQVANLAIEPTSANALVDNFAIQPQNNDTNILPVAFFELYEEEKQILTPILEITKVYHDNLNRFNKYILNQNFNQITLNDTNKMNVNTGYDYDHITFSGDNKSSIDSLYLFMGLENQFNSYTNLYFNFGYDANNFDLSGFKNVYEENLYLSAYVNNPLDFANLNYGYIGMLKLGNKLDADHLDNVKGKFKANSHRLFFNMNKDFNITKDFYLTTGLNINFDFINLSKIQFTTITSSDPMPSKLKFKDSNNVISSQSLSVMLNKDFINLVNNLNLKLFAGFDINYTKKSISLTANNIRGDTSANDRVSGFELKDYSYFMVGIKLDLLNNTTLNIYEKSNISLKRDHKINTSISLNF